MQERNLDTAIEISLETVKKRAVKGVAILTGRGFLLNAITTISQLALLAFLEPEQIGVFYIVSAAVYFLMYFSDIGLAAALIQKKEKLADSDLKTTFTIQQSLVILLIMALYLASPYLADFYNLSREGQYLLYALGFSLLLSSLKSIPSVLLERKLEFGKFVLPEILENLFYNVSLVFFAWYGLGIRSFTYAVLIRGVVGVVAIYTLQPWKPGLAFSRKSLKELLGFGVPYQVNSLISVFKDHGITLLLGGILAQAEIGFLGTAQRLTQIPLRLFMDNVTKVSFPAFSRMQDQPRELARVVSRSIMFVTFLVYPSLIGALILLPDIMILLPKYQKWGPALPLMWIMTVNVLFAAFATQVTNMLTAIGKIKKTIQITIIYTVLTILTVPALAYLYRTTGAAVGYAFVGLSSVIAIYIGKKYVDFSIIKAAKPIFAAILMGIYVYALRNLLPVNWISLGVEIATGGVLYLVLSYFLMGPELLVDARKIILNAIKKA